MVQVPKSPIITPEAINYLETNGLLKPSKRKRLSLLRLHKPKNSAPSTTKEQPSEKEKKITVRVPEKPERKIHPRKVFIVHGRDVKQAFLPIHLNIIYQKSKCNFFSGLPTLK